MGQIELYNIDCMEYMSTCTDKQFDLAIVDPPYGIGVSDINFGARDIKNASCDGRDWDNLRPSVEYFNELRRVSKHQIIWGANYFNCFNGKHGAIIWDKLQPLPTSSQCEIASCTLHQKVALYKQTWTNYVNDKSTNHPTEKPVQLYKWLLKNYSDPSQKIIDTHLGSGSSAIAAYDYGCDFVGMEIDKDYYDAMMKRYTTHTMQTKLF